MKVKPIVVEVGKSYWSISLQKAITITKQDKCWYLDKDGVGWTKQGRRLGDTYLDLLELSKYSR